MTKSFEYFYVTTAMDELVVDDIGNCIIEANDDEGNFYYLIIRTAYGVTRILEYGPYIDGGFPLSCSCTFKQFDYHERKISKAIEKFLSKPLYTQAQLIDNYADISARLKNLTEYLEW